MTTLDAGAAVEADPPAGLGSIVAPRTLAPRPALRALPVTEAAPFVAATAGVAPRVEPALERRRRWERVYARRLRWSDTVTVIVVTLAVACLDAVISQGGIADV